MNRQHYPPQTVKTGEYPHGEWRIERTADDGKVQLYKRTFQPDLGAPQPEPQFSLFDGSTYHRIEKDAYSALWSAMNDIVTDDALYEAWEAVEDTRDSFLEMTR